MQIPLIALDRVLHIGTLNPADLGRNAGSTSQEGNFLSVSLCPLAWRRIARLGGYRLHELTRQGGLFVDVTAILDAPELLAPILDWARAEGLVEDRGTWQAWSYDSEADAWRFTSHPTEAKARHELGHDREDFDPEDVDEPDHGPAIRPVTVPVATAALRALLGENLDESFDATEAAARAWCLREAPALLGRPLDGVWWDEPYAPEVYHAPRGAIFPERVAAWGTRPLNWAGADDDHELSMMPETRWEDLPSPSPSP